uniref:Uncharacterized protein n=1 Tax=Glossina pallidipes TaxID=7398 RepID=A0A1A9ZTL4_GLOPL
MLTYKTQAYVEPLLILCSCYFKVLVAGLCLIGRLVMNYVIIENEGTQPRRTHRTAKPYILGDSGLVSIRGHLYKNITLVTLWYSRHDDFEATGVKEDPYKNDEQNVQFET